jgi:hypothetical protein
MEVGARLKAAREARTNLKDSNSLAAQHTCKASAGVRRNLSYEIARPHRRASSRIRKWIERISALPRAGNCQEAFCPDVGNIARDITLADVTD